MDIIDKLLQLKQTIRMAYDMCQCSEDCEIGLEDAMVELDWILEDFATPADKMQNVYVERRYGDVDPATIDIRDYWIGGAS